MISTRTFRGHVSVLVGLLCVTIAIGTPTLARESHLETPTSSATDGPTGVCGNFIIDPGETCDPPFDFVPGTGCFCEGGCTYCGDGIIDSGEDCDDGNCEFGDGCDAFCFFEFCGDGAVQPALGEQCDDGNTANGDGCDANCQIEFGCGNGVIEAGEDCDEFGFSPTCDDDCTFPVCGDGVLNTLAGEVCDDGNTSDGDGCEFDCTLPGPLTLGASIQFPVQSTPRSVTVADFDRDGIPDVAVANAGSDSVSVLLGRGDGTLEPQIALEVGVLPVWILGGDFDRDDNPDLAVVNAVDESFPTAAPGTVSVLLGRGDGTFEGQVVHQVGLLPSAAVAADLDADGNVDLAVTNTESDTVSILLGVGDGTFTPGAEVPLPDFTRPTLVVVGDFDGGAELDLIVSRGTGASRVSVLIGDGSGGFPQTYSQTVGGSSVTTLGVADLDADGRADLVVGHQGPAGPPIDGGIEILRGSAGGGFGLPISPNEVASRPRTVTLADFLVDGNLDSVTAHSLDDVISILIGRGGVLFEDELRHPVGNAPTALDSADFNGDGLEDLVIAHGLDDVVSIVLNGAEPPNLAPIAEAGPAQSVEAAAARTALVTLDGSESTDPNSTPGTTDDIASYEWYRRSTLLGQGVMLDVELPVGTSELTLRVTDSRGLEDTDDVTVTVVAGPGVPIPTVGEWAMLLMTLLFVTAGTVVFGGARLRASGAGTFLASGPVPVAPRPLLLALGILAVAWTLALTLAAAIGQPVTETDAVGAALCGIALAYLAHLWLMLGLGGRR